MRRLIDQDKLCDDIEYWENHAEPGMEDYDTRDIEQVVGFQPLVDAIPVEFIEEQMRKYEELAYNSTPKIQQRYFDKEAALKTLIDNWHKENGEIENETREMGRLF